MTRGAACFLALSIGFLVVPTQPQQFVQRTNVGVPLLLGSISSSGDVLTFAGNCATCSVPYDKLVIFNTQQETAEIIERIGGNPLKASITSDGKRVYVSSIGPVGRGPFSIGVYDIEKKEKRKIPLSSLPYGIKVTQDGKQVYIAEPGLAFFLGETALRNVRGFDTASGKQNFLTNLSQVVPFLLYLSHDEKKAYVTGRLRGKSIAVAVVDLEAATEIATIDTGLSRNPQNPLILGAVISEDEKTMLISDLEEGKLIVIDLTTQKLRTVIEVGSFPMGIQISQDGTTAYVANHNSQTVSVVNLNDNVVQDSLAVGCSPVDLILSPQGEWLYISCEEGVIVKMAVNHL